MLFSILHHDNNIMTVAGGRAMQAGKQGGRGSGAWGPGRGIRVRGECVQRLVDERLNGEH